MAGPTTSDKAEDIGNNILTGIPGVGTIVNGYRVAMDLATMAGGESTDPTQVNRDLASDALGMVPLLGTAMSVGGVAYDILAPDDTAGNLTNQLLGGTDKYPGDTTDGAGPSAANGAGSSSAGAPQSSSAGAPQSSSAGAPNSSSAGPNACSSSDSE